MNFRNWMWLGTVRMWMEWAEGMLLDWIREFSVSPWLWVSVLSLGYSSCLIWATYYEWFMGRKWYLLINHSKSRSFSINCFLHCGRIYRSRISPRPIHFTSLRIFGRVNTLILSRNATSTSWIYWWQWRWKSWRGWINWMQKRTSKKATICCQQSRGRL